MAQITLLDGAIGQELVKRSNDRATPLWSTRVMIDHPDLVGQVHRDYFRAGATVATTNTYAVQSTRLDRVELSHKIPELLACALDQAQIARAEHGSGRVAGAIGPFYASYRPDLMPDPEVAAATFREMAGQMAAKVDLFLMETVSSVIEAEGALRGVSGLGKPVWLALSVMDDDGTRLRSGEPLGAVLDLVKTYKPEAVLVNCSRPEAFPAAMEILAGFGVPFGGYANGFTHISDGFKTDAPTVDALEQRTDLGPETYGDLAMDWVAAGATIVGGCCEVGPAHIETLAQRLRDAGHQIV
ncbi:MAG: homocysteine S-methyltransferase family protein [Sedimentitalea sp.]